MSRLLRVPENAKRPLLERRNMGLWELAETFITNHKAHARRDGTGDAL